MIFNIPGIKNLVLNVRHLPSIYAGNISYWDHPEIVQLNPGVRLPHEKIIPVASAGDSGDARIITEAFSNFDNNWKEEHGVFTDPKFVGGVCCESQAWPRGVVKYFGKRTIGMIGIVASIPYTIGYMASSASGDMDVPTVALQNFMGYRVGPTTEAVKAAVDFNKLQNPDALTYTLSNAMDPKAYPMVAFNYFIFNISTTPGITCCQMEELAGFVEWMLGRSTAFFESQGAVSFRFCWMKHLS